MRRALACLLLVCVSLIAFDPVFINIQAKIFPQVLLFDTKLEDKKINNTLVVVVTGEESQAMLFFKTAKDMYSSSIKGLPIRFVMMKSKEVTVKTPMSALVVLGDDIQSIRTLSGVSAQKNIMMFVDTPEMFRYGGCISLEVGKQVKPVIHSRALKEHNIQLSSGFIALARIVND